MKPGLNNRLVIILSIAVVVLLYMYFAHPNIKEVKVPVTVEVPVPVIEQHFDTIYKPKPIYILKSVSALDSTYYNKYTELKDSIQKDSLFKDAITIREYKTKFEDDTLTIDVYSKVRGTLLENQASYKTKPRTIKHDTTIYVPVPTRAQLYGGFELTMPTANYQTLGNQPQIEAKLHLKTKKDRLWSVGINNQKQVSIGYAWKF